MSVPWLGVRVILVSAFLTAGMVSAGIAQAETTTSWLVNGSKFTSALNPTLEAETDTEGVLLTELGGKHVHLKCPTIKLSAHLVEPTAQFTGKADFKKLQILQLKNCRRRTRRTEFCEPNAEGVAGLIETNSITGSIVLHEGKGALEVKPTAEGGLFATVQLGEPGAKNECAFGESIKLGGVLFLEDSSFSTDAVKHLVKELSALTKLTVNGTKTATLDGSAWAFLGGAHKGLTWSGQAT
jgi:hypothetical protein